MAGLQDVEWEACLLEPRRDPAFERDVRREGGMVPPMLAYFASCPWVARSIASFNEHRIGLVEIDFALADLIGLVVAQDNSCRYCYATQRALLRVQGHSERRIRQIEDDLLAALVEPRERAGLEFAHRISRCSPRPEGADRARLRALGWREAGIREIAVIAAVNVYLNRIATIPALPVRRALGIGLHRGVGVAGLVGSRDLLRFTVVGRTVNVAARVQALTRDHGCDALLTEPVRAALDPRFALRSLPPAQARGLAAPVEIFALEGFAEAAPGEAGDQETSPSEPDLAPEASSGRWFDGWRREPVSREPPGGAREVARPGTWLLSVGWRRHGLIDPAEVPGR